MHSLSSAVTSFRKDLACEIFYRFCYKTPLCTLVPDCLIVHVWYIHILTEVTGGTRTDCLCHTLNMSDVTSNAGPKFNVQWQKLTLHVLLQIQLKRGIISGKQRFSLFYPFYYYIDFDPSLSLSGPFLISASFRDARK